MKITKWILRAVPALILLQTLFFKFSGAEESIYIFEKVGLEPAGRYGSAVVELIAGILLLIPTVTWLGAILALGTISGAIFFHLTTLGIVVKDDGGTLFMLACLVAVTCAILLWLERRNLPIIGPKLFGAAENSTS